MTSECPRCNEDEFGIIKNQRDYICVDCGFTNGDRKGGSLRHHEGRVRRIKLLAGELHDMNLNIRTDDDVEKAERLLNLIIHEVERFHQWIGEEADLQHMREYGNARDTSPRGSWERR